MSTLNERILLLFLLGPDPTRSYYSITLSLNESRAPSYSCFSEWVDFTEDKPRREIRKASLVDAERLYQTWRTFGEPGMVVNTVEDFSIFFAFGGHAIVEETLAEKVIPQWLAPSVVASVGQLGFVSVTDLPNEALQRAPTPKHRMKILQRDGYRCRVCGRSPKDHVDVELHVHHIRPWSMGGVTEDINLITLCHTCHNGLEPHFDCSLYMLLSSEPSTNSIDQYQEQVRDYQTQLAIRAKGRKKSK